MYWVPKEQFLIKSIPERVHVLLPSHNTPTAKKEATYFLQLRQLPYASGEDPHFHTDTLEIDHPSTHQ